MSVILLLHTILLALTFGNFQLLTVDYHSIDEPIVELNNYTLREVFDTPLNLNSDFNTNTTSWATSNSTGSVNSGIYTFTATAQGGEIKQLITGLTIGDYYYSIARVKSNVNSYLRLGIIIQTNVISNDFQHVSLIRQASAVQHEVAYTNNQLSGWLPIEVDYIKTYNMSSLGISSLTVARMDYWFDEYQNNIGADDVTYTINEHDMTDLIILLGFGFSWIGILWIIRKVIS